MTIILCLIAGVALFACGFSVGSDGTKFPTFPAVVLGLSIMGLAIHNGPPSIAPVDRNPKGGNEVPSRSDESAVTPKAAGAQPEPSS